MEIQSGRSGWKSGENPFPGRNFGLNFEAGDLIRSVFLTNHGNIEVGRISESQSATCTGILENSRDSDSTTALVSLSRHEHPFQEEIFPDTQLEIST